VVEALDKDPAFDPSACEESSGSTTEKESPPQISAIELEAISDEIGMTEAMESSEVGSISMGTAGKCPSATPSRVQIGGGSLGPLNYVNRSARNVEEKRKLLDDLAANFGKMLGGEIVLSMLEQGAKAASDNPRDVATFYCLYTIFRFLLRREQDERLSCLGFGVKGAQELIEYSQKCLLRCLDILDQAISTGMVGWLEYGDSTQLDRSAERPLEVLRLHAYDLCRRGLWNDAECVLVALVLRCEQRLPLYHPTTLSSMLDLSVALAKNGKHGISENTLTRVAGRLSSFLCEMESGYFSHLRACRPGVKRGDTYFQIESGRECISMLESFCSVFRGNLVKGIPTLLGHDDEVYLFNHALLGDALSVLANCLSAARCVLGTTCPDGAGDGTHYWRLAFAHYQRAFKGFLLTKGLDDAFVYRTAFGIARCLREFSETEKALELLKLVVSAQEERPRDAETDSVDGSTNRDKSGKENVDGSSFLPHALLLRSNLLSGASQAGKHVSSALCLWLMAILSVDCSPNESGREAAFSYLHAASVSLQTALRKISSDDESTRVACIHFLGIIEQEASLITEPID
jgi:hypothetical protein